MAAFRRNHWPLCLGFRIQPKLLAMNITRTVVILLVGVIIPLVVIVVLVMAQ